MKPVIGITPDLVTTQRARQPKMELESGYFESIIAAGGIPMILPPHPREELLEAYLDRVDGLLLNGSGDLNPRKLGKKPHPAIRPMHEQREASDRMLCKLAIERKLPMLCLGVSMQLMNVLFGGTIYLHLPEDMPRALPHFDPVEGTHRHVVFVTPTTRLEKIYGEGEIRVNSDHHQGIRTLGKGLRSGALAPDGLIEAIESIDRDWFMIGVQWHPAADSASALDRQLFEGFVANCRTSEARILSMAA